MSNKVLVIAGMHRSGTSLITQWLRKCGLPVGDDLMGEGIANLEGHFEDLDFVRLHEELLREINTDDSGLELEALPDWSAQQKQKINELIIKKNSLYTMWGFKDPRTCVFLEAYREVVPDAHYLVIVRDFKAVVSSLLSRMHREADINYAKKGGFKWWFWRVFERENRKRMLIRKRAKTYLKACTLYNEALLQLVNAVPESRCLVVDYAQLIREDDEVFSTLQKDWQFSGLRYRPFSDIFKEKLISKQWDFFHVIKDKSLIARAEQSEKNLRAVIK